MKTIVSALIVTALLSTRVWAQDSDATLHSALERDLNGYLTTRATVEHISALSLSVELPGRRTNINVVAGRTAWKSGPAITPANLFNIGSNTKAFTACVILQLEAEGKLSIDQTVGHWLPQYPAWSNVTIRHLLDMTSGIPGYDNVPAMLQAEAKTIQRRWTDPQLVAFVDPVYGKAPPPTHGYDYSNTNYILAGMIIERVSGHSYADEVRRRLIDGLGLRDMYYSPNVYPKSVIDRLLSGYFFNNSPDNEPLAPLLGRDMRLNDLSWAASAGGIIATPEDVTRWARALYGGRVLAPKQQRELMSIVSTKTGKPIGRPTAADPSGFGLGVVQAYRPNLGTYWFYQGETLGYRVIHIWLPKSDTVFAIGLNSQPPSSQGAYVGHLIEKVYKDLLASGAIRSNV
jgi:D-alanyl-D-alanine carboxypeptidase